MVLTQPDDQPTEGSLADLVRLVRRALSASEGVGSSYVGIVLFLVDADDNGLAIGEALELEQIALRGGASTKP